MNARGHSGGALAFRLINPAMVGEQAQWYPFDASTDRAPRFSLTAATTGSVDRI
jgi:hypothetical protein